GRADAGRRAGVDPRASDAGHCRDDPRYPGGSDVPGRHQACHRARADKMTSVIPGRREAVDPESGSFWIEIRGRCLASSGTTRGGRMIPGERFIKDGEIELNAGRKTVTLTVANSGDRPIQVGSHYHFFETNPALKFDRKKARGMRLDIAAGTAVRFEPGQTRDVQLVALAGKRVV